MHDEWKETLWTNINNLLTRLEAGLRQSPYRGDDSVYTGTAGISLLYLKLASADAARKDEFLNTAVGYVEKYLPTLRGKRISFLCGDAGPLAIAAILYHQLGMESESESAIRTLQKMNRNALDLESGVPDELLYGRVGYLYALMLIQKHIGADAIDKEIISQIIDVILKSGISLSKKENRQSPLMYMWHDSYYLGAAHGLCGIMFMLLQAHDYVKENDLNTLIKPTIDYLMTLKYPSGNYPSSLGSKSDRLVHWCHGAPGFIYMFAMAYKVFEDKKYLEAALDCGEVIWKRGLLRKGCGLCHGSSGNGSAFLLLHRVTDEPKHLYRAAKFAEWCFDYEKNQCRVADSPLSLFEGLAGVIYFLINNLDPDTAEFPAFQIW